MPVFIAKGKTGNLKKGLKYADKDRRYENDFSLCRGINCSNFVDIAYQEMFDVKKIYGKEGGREFKHYVLSFAPNEIDKANAIEYAALLTKKCFGEHYQAFVGLHTQSKSGILHAHIIVNSVSFIDGRKIHFAKRELERFKGYNDELSIKYNLKIIDRTPSAVRERGRPQMYSMNEYQLNKKISSNVKGKTDSFVRNCYAAVSNSLSKNPKKFADFVFYMKREQWGVKLNGKNMVFYSLKNSRQRLRANTLAKKYNMEKLSTAGILEQCNVNVYHEYKIQDKYLAEHQHWLNEFKIQESIKEHTMCRSYEDDYAVNKLKPRLRSRDDYCL